MRSQLLACVLAAAGVAAASGRAGAGEILRIEDVSDQDVVTEAFSLSRGVRVRVVCTGAGEHETMYAYGWILDARTREVVWSLVDEDTRSHKRAVTFDGWITLPAGDYLASYTAFGEWRRRLKIVRLLGRELFRFEIDDGRKKPGQKRSGDASDWAMRLDVADSDDSAVDRNLPPSSTRGDRVVVRLTGIDNDELVHKGFSLPGEMRLTVYAIGEGDPDDDYMADSGWILDAATRKRVWVLGPRNGRHAGGARKNRYARETIVLPAGNYIAYYATDDSHAAGDWNAPPPYDPDFWGLTIWAASAADAERVRPYVDAPDGKPLVALIRQGNDAYATQGLTVSRASEVRVYALGEYAGSQFADEGWIEDFKSRRRVWEMSADNTHPAGGSAKNRFADDVVALAPGDYVVYYRTDDSHAYEEWNAAPPADPTHWGITLEARGRRDDSFKTFDAELRSEEGKEFLVRLVRVGSGEHVRKRFHVERSGPVRIFALGEGVDGEMYDAGWIERVGSREAVWEMRLEDTRHAGGAHKNRVADTTIRLERGDYEAHYRTDGSHAWGDWNAAPPRDPQLWGITVTTESGGR